jgi:hypothetical protein
MRGCSPRDLYCLGCRCRRRKLRSPVKRPTGWNDGASQKASRESTRSTQGMWSTSFRI